MEDLGVVMLRILEGVKFRSCNAKDFERCKKVACQADFLGIGCTLKRVYV